MAHRFGRQVRLRGPNPPASYKSTAPSAAREAPSPPARKRDADLKASSATPVSATPPLVPPLPAHHQRTARAHLLVNGADGSGGGGGGVSVGSPWGGQRGRVEEAADYKGRGHSHSHGPHTQTLKGTRVKASNGDNYIILAPINPGSQVLAAGPQGVMVQPRLLPFSYLSQ